MRGAHDPGMGWMERERQWPAGGGDRGRQGSSSCFRRRRWPRAISPTEVCGSRAVSSRSSPPGSRCRSSDVAGRRSPRSTDWCPHRKPRLGAARALRHGRRRSLRGRHGAVPRVVGRAMAKLAVAACGRADTHGTARGAPRVVGTAAVSRPVPCVDPRVLRAVQPPGRIAVIQHRDHRRVDLVRGLRADVVANRTRCGVHRDRERRVHRSHAAVPGTRNVRPVPGEDDPAHSALDRDAARAPRGHSESRSASERAEAAQDDVIAARRSRRCGETSAASSSPVAACSRLTARSASIACPGCTISSVVPLCRPSISGGEAACRTAGRRWSDRRR